MTDSGTVLTMACGNFYEFIIENMPLHQKKFLNLLLSFVDVFTGDSFVKLESKNH